MTPISLDAVDATGHDLSRPECVLALRNGTLFVSDKNDRDAILRGGLNGTVDLDSGSGIAPHRIHSNLDHERPTCDRYSSAIAMTSRSL